MVEKNNVKVYISTPLKDGEQSPYRLTSMKVEIAAHPNVRIDAMRREQGHPRVT